MTLTQDSAHPTANEPYIGAVNHTMPDDSVVFGKSEQMLALRAKLKLVASSNLPVLIEGESGTGKEVIARLLHQWSPVAAAPFVHVSCPAFPSTLFEREMFAFGNGYSKNGTHGEEHRRFSLAGGGTLCLDEIGELDASLQAKLLQFLQDGFIPTGPQANKAVIRIVCATDRDLEPAVLSGAFRRDLFYRINVVKLHLPSLRERAVDVPDLCSYFVRLYNEEFNCNAKPVSASLLNALQQYQWPGNIRQLANLMKRYVVLDSEDLLRNEIGDKTRPKESVSQIAADASMSLQDASRQVKRTFERQQILRALEANHWNRKRAARALNISYRALLYKLKECRLEIPATE
jgi:two-component system response regulator AtoC